MSLDVLASGAVTCVGFGAPETFAAIRAGLTGFAAFGSPRASQGSGVWAEVPLRPRPHDARIEDRVLAMAVVAIRECLVSGALDARRCALVLGTWEAHRELGSPAWRASGFLREISARTGLAPERCSLVPAGNASCVVALGRARELLQDAAIDACIVGGVDSLLTRPWLKELNGSFRAKSDVVAQGLIPGEGASFVAVSRSIGSRRRARVLGFALAQEPIEHSVLSQGHPTGAGLASAIESALVDSGVSESSISGRVSDLNGESYAAFDALLASSRAYRTRRESFPLTLPAASVGETGAAAGALCIAYASYALMKGLVPGGHVMCELSSESGLRGCCVVARPAD